MQRTWVLVGTVVLLALVVGCTGSGGDGDGGSGGADWCETGSFEAVASQQAGGSVTVEMQGVTEREGREVCHISYDIDDQTSQYARLDVFFDEGQDHVEFVYYDADGNEVGRIDYSGSTDGRTDAGSDGSDAGSGDAGDSSDSAGGSASWCQVGQTVSVSDSEAGSEMTSASRRWSSATGWNSVGPRGR